MSNIVLRVTGVAFLILLFLRDNSIPAETISGCDVFKDIFGRQKGDCSSRGISKIPSDLGADITMLDVSNNTNITQLDKDDLKNYPKLWGLNIGNLPLTEFPIGFFQYTSKIRMLNMSRTRIKNLKEIPNSIKILNYTYSSCEYIDISHLINLEKLLLRFSIFLKKIPAMSSSAPLRVLDVKNCSLIEAEYPQVAPFCKLTYFGLNSSHLFKESYVKQCCGLRKWGIHWNITGVRHQSCSRLTYQSCNNLSIVLDAQSIQLYKDCYYKEGVKKYFILLAIVLFSVILIVAAILASTWYYYHHFDIPFWDRNTGKKSVYTLSSSEMETEAEID